MIATTNRRGPVLFWFHHEAEYLRRHFADQTNAEIAARLGRSVNSVRRKAAALGLRRAEKRPRRWTEERRARFADSYRRSPIQTGREFGLRPKTVRNYRTKFCGKSRTRWTAQERELIRDLYPLGNVAELRRLLPHRTLHAIHIAASRSMGKTLRRYPTADERDTIARDYGRVPIAQLAERLGMNQDQIRAHARRLGLTKPRNPKATR